ncbi:AMP-binding protein [Pseudaquidulcibacter saccharophilus]|uniref:AMP-binding protein n=1 Tax=Pseudaquidulcibacter saccharophilus TaxID=2831900 RepID=UPI001EFF11C7|nr:AMP-binding protein [Pseudaquidulcibacter saccharophilus]
MNKPERIWEKHFPQGAKWNEKLNITSLCELLDESAKKFKDKTVFEYRDTKITYGDFGNMVHKLSQGLVNHGVKKGDKIALYLPNTIFHPLAFFAILKAGAIVVHLSPLDAINELRQKLKIVDCRKIISINQEVFCKNTFAFVDDNTIDELILCDDDFWGKSPLNLSKYDGKNHVTMLDEIIAKASDVILPDVLIDDTALLQFTGGTTGYPKAAILTHSNLSTAVNQSRNFTEPYEVKSGTETAICVLPLFHIYALVGVLLRHVIDGSRILIKERFDMDEIIYDIEHNKASALASVPTMWFALLHHPRANEIDFSALKFCVSGGAPLPFEVHNNIEKLIGTMLGVGWGMTETCASGTRVPVGQKIRPRIIGIPIPEVDIKILDFDNDYKEVEIGQSGEIAVKGGNVFSGYYNDPTANQESFKDGYFLTGDIGSCDENGVFEIIDRRKNMIISGGFNVYPVNIENAIYQRDGVAECIVIGIPDEYRGQSAKAFIKLKPNAEKFTLDELKEFLGDKLGRHEIPTALEFRDDLPKSAAGKLLARVLIDEENAKNASLTSS